jgi:hypothetical protein
LPMWMMSDIEAAGFVALVVIMAVAALVVL